MEKKELKDLDLLDRFLFAEAIEDPETMELILEIILGREVILKHLPQAEKEQRSFLWSKQVKLDVWAKDVDDVVYDTEVQKQNSTDETASKAGSKRISRLHEKISDIKASEEIGVKFMNAWEEKLLDRQEGYDEGKQEGLRIGEEKGRKEGMEAGEKKGLRIGEERGLKTGRKEERKEIAVRMKARGMSLEEIAEITGLELSQLEKL